MNCECCAGTAGAVLELGGVDLFNCAQWPVSRFNRSQLPWLILAIDPEGGDPQHPLHLSDSDNNSDSSDDDLSVPVSVPPPGHRLLSHQYDALPHVIPTST